jgi:hypothetical protein
MPQDNMTRMTEDMDHDAQRGTALLPNGSGFSYMGTLEDTLSPVRPLDPDSFTPLADQDEQHHPVRELTPG